MINQAIHSIHTHTYMHAYIHTHIHICIHTYITKQDSLDILKQFFNLKYYTNKATYTKETDASTLGNWY